MQGSKAGAGPGISPGGAQSPWEVGTEVTGCGFSACSLCPIHSCSFSLDLSNLIACAVFLLKAFHSGLSDLGLNQSLLKVWLESLGTCMVAANPLFLPTSGGIVAQKWEVQTCCFSSSLSYRHYQSHSFRTVVASGCSPGLSENLRWSVFSGSWEFQLFPGPQSW